MLGGLAKARFLTLVKVAVSLGPIAYICTRPTSRGADWGNILSGIRPGPWLLALAVYFASIGLNVLKWQRLLRTLGVHVARRTLFRTTWLACFSPTCP